MKSATTTGKGDSIHIKLRMIYFEPMFNFEAAREPSSSPLRHKRPVPMDDRSNLLTQLREKKTLNVVLCVGTI
jgi:hypothetical protein